MGFFDKVAAKFGRGSSASNPEATTGWQKVGEKNTEQLVAAEKKAESAEDREKRSVAMLREVDNLSSSVNEWGQKIVEAKQSEAFHSPHAGIQEAARAEVIEMEGIRINRQQELKAAVTERTNEFVGEMNMGEMEDVLADLEKADPLSPLSGLKPETIQAMKNKVKNEMQKEFNDVANGREFYLSKFYGKVKQQNGDGTYTYKKGPTIFDERPHLARVAGFEMLKQEIEASDPSFKA